MKSESPPNPWAQKTYTDAIALLGREINLASPKQLREALFVDMQLPPTTATSSGPSVSTSELVKLHEKHPNDFLRLVLRFRGVDVGERAPEATVPPHG